ncbi:MAG: DUF58 domain-containing protein [Pirellulaceae bacterium]
MIPNWLDNIGFFLVTRPMILLGIMGLPLVGVAVWRRAFPTLRMVGLAVVPLLFSLLTIYDGSLYWLSLVANVLLLIVVAMDLVFGRPGKSSFSFERQLQRVMSLAKSQVVDLEMTNHSKRNWDVEIADDLPIEFIAEPASISLDSPALSRRQFSYRVSSNQRGAFWLRGTHLRVGTRLKLWNVYHFYELPAEVNVYPDLKQISEYGLLARTNRLNLMGVRRSRRIGQDNEFERLRDYSRDDNPKFIDWRATARKRKLIVKDFQQNQNQSIIFMVDTGRMMTNHSGEISMLDHALNAMLMMSYVALKQGDSVGLMTFSNRVHRYTPPKSGTRQVNRLLHAVFDQHADYSESNFDSAFSQLSTCTRKRSLVVLITNVIDEINAGYIERHLSNLTGRHLPLGVLLRDHDLYDPLEAYANVNELTSDGATDNRMLMNAAAAAEIAKWRFTALRSLEHKGVLVIDTFPEQLSSTLVNRYLEIKARHLL